MPVQALDSPAAHALSVLAGLEEWTQADGVAQTPKTNSRSIPRDREGSHQVAGEGDAALGPDGRCKVGLGVSHPEPARALS